MMGFCDLEVLFELDLDVFLGCNISCGSSDGGINHLKVKWR